MDNFDFDEIQKRFDDRYVLQTKCTDIQTKNNTRFANDDKRLEKQEDFAKGLKKFLWIGLSALIGEVVISFIQLLRGVI